MCSIRQIVVLNLVCLVNLLTGRELHLQHEQRGDYVSGQDEFADLYDEVRHLLDPTDDTQDHVRTMERPDIGGHRYHGVPKMRARNRKLTLATTSTSTVPAVPATTAPDQTIAENLEVKPQDGLIDDFVDDYKALLYEIELELEKEELEKAGTATSVKPEEDNEAEAVEDNLESDYSNDPIEQTYDHLLPATADGENVTDFGQASPTEENDEVGAGQFELMIDDQNAIEDQSGLSYPDLPPDLDSPDLSNYDSGLATLESDDFHGGAYDIMTWPAIQRLFNGKKEEISVHVSNLTSSTTTARPKLWNELLHASEALKIERNPELVCGVTTASTMMLPMVEPIFDTFVGKRVMTFTVSAQSSGVGRWTLYRRKRADNRLQEAISIAFTFENGLLAQIRTEESDSEKPGRINIRPVDGMPLLSRAEYVDRMTMPSTPVMKFNFALVIDARKNHIEVFLVGFASPLAVINELDLPVDDLSHVRFESTASSLQSQRIAHTWAETVMANVLCSKRADMYSPCVLSFNCGPENSRCQQMGQFYDNHQSQKMAKANSSTLYLTTCGLAQNHCSLCTCEEGSILVGNRCLKPFARDLCSRTEVIHYPHSMVTDPIPLVDVPKFGQSRQSTIVSLLAQTGGQRLDIFFCSSKPDTGILNFLPVATSPCYVVQLHACPHERSAKQNVISLAKRLGFLRTDVNNKLQYGIETKSVVSSSTPACLVGQKMDLPSELTIEMHQIGPDDNSASDANVAVEFIISYIYQGRPLTSALVDRQAVIQHLDRIYLSAADPDPDASSDLHNPITVKYDCRLDVGRGGDCQHTNQCADDLICTRQRYNIASDSPTCV